MNAGWSRDEPEEVLDALVGARLLTSYERDGEAGEKQRQVEIVHESLLASWPRLVRWRTQDADGVQLRDHLHQAARLWQDRGRPEDLLWSGAAYRDLALWRERHRVPLTAAEDDFVRATERKATRRRGRRRAAVVAIVALAASVSMVTTVLWRSADVSRQKAEAETLRAEASKLLALAQLERESYPTAALAWVTRSLELADTPEARLFALGILQASPTAQLAPMPADDMDGLEAMFPAFSPSGEWLAVGGLRRIRLLNRDGRPPRALGGYPSVGINGLRPLFGPLSDRLVTAQAADVRALSVPDGREIWNRPAPVESIGALALTGDAFLTAKLADRRLFIREWPLDGGVPRLVGSVQDVTDYDLQGSRLVHRNGRRIHLREVASWDVPIAVGVRLSSDRGGVAVSADGRLVAASDERGEIQIWRTSDQGPHPLRVLQARGWMQFDARGHKLVVAGSQDGVAQARVFDLEGPPGAAPQVLRRSDIPYLNGVAFDPQGRWLALGNVDATSLWALDGHRPHVLKQESVSSIAFSPDGTTLMSASFRGLRALYLGKDAPEASRLLYESPHNLQFPGLAFDPSGLRVAVAGAQGWIALVPAQGGTPRRLSGFSEKADLRGTLFADGGRLLAATAWLGPRHEKVVRVWNLETGEVRTIGPMPGAGDGFAGAIRSLKGLGTYGAVLAVEGFGLVQVDLRTGSHLIVTKELDRLLDSRPNTGLLLACRFQRALERCTPAVLDLGRNDLRLLTTHGHSSASGAFDPSGTLIATGSFDGIVRVGWVSGEEPHVLLGLKGEVLSVAFSPDGRFVAASDEAGTIHLWPVPDVTRLPFHRKPHAELLAALRTHTNLRAVADAASPGGYKLEPGPFPGWVEPPQW